MVAGIRLSAAALSTAVPVAVEPVKPILAMPLLWAKAVPASAPKPATTLIEGPLPVCQIRNTCTVCSVQCHINTPLPFRYAVRA
jgi:hypothetical protein